MKLGIVGLGYVGLPLAVAFAEAGNDVVGLDTDPASSPASPRAAATSRTSPTPRWRRPRRAPPPDQRLRRPRRPARRSSSACRRRSPSSREPDLTYLLEAAAARRRAPPAGPADRARVDHLPGHHPRASCCRSSRSRRQPSARDFHLAFSPERIDPGRTDHTVRTTPKLVGGITPACTERARALYAEICDDGRRPHLAGDRRALEAAREHLPLGQHRPGQRVRAALRPARDRRLGGDRRGGDQAVRLHALRAGPGMGGHCLPVDPFYLAFKAREHDFYPEFIELAGKVNQAQPAYCVRADRARPERRRKPVKGSKILILGAAYKAGIGDTRESPALRIMTLLREPRRRALLPRPLRAGAARPGSGVGRPRGGARRGRSRGDRHRPPARSTTPPRSPDGAAGDRLPRRHPRLRRRQRRAPLTGASPAPAGPW